MAVLQQQPTSVGAVLARHGFREPWQERAGRAPHLPPAAAHPRPHMRSCTSRRRHNAVGAGLARHGFPRTVAGTCGASPAPTSSGRTPSPAHALLHIAAAAQRRRCRACPARLSRTVAGTCGASPAPTSSGRTASPAHALLHIAAAAQRRRCRACPARLSANRGGSVRGEPRTYGMAGCSDRSLPTLCGAGSAPTSSGRAPSPARAPLHVAAASHLRRCRACPARFSANRGGSVRGKPRTYRATGRSAG